MRKILLSAAALIVGAASYAQISGAPTSLTVSALPGAVVTTNTGESIQNGNGNKVRLRQAGTNQSVFTEQSNGTGLGGNLGDVMQTGSVDSDSGALNTAELQHFRFC